MKYALALLLLAPWLAQADCSTNWMDCTADSPVEVSSFTMRATEVIGAITASRLTATARLQRHEITAAQAQAVQNKADLARALWQQARLVCHADRAGNCPKNSAAAFALLTRAQKALQ